ncbi:hypothetical protein L2E82_28077 [Cichorium intybus]|uniref:Uncharacterized protein n=1 Tax=Cichorium intybus TaxID=13427 RepID=A0ACB9CUP8_CICIN|nr:hypothetical protein L2E82_28077 [Cichorium intybus]
MVIMFQYFEFPYGDVSSSLFSAGKSQPPVSGSLQDEASSNILKSLSNITHVNGSNYTNPLDILEKGNKIIHKGDKDAFEMKHNSTVDKVQETKGLVTNNATQPVGNLSIGGVSYSTLQEKDSDAASSPAPITPPPTFDTTVVAPSIVLNNNTFKPDVGAPNADHKKESATSHVNVVPFVKESHVIQMGDVVTISQMHDILLHNRAYVRSAKPQWSLTVDEELLDAKYQIENAPITGNDRALYPPLYRNVSRFKRSYELMEKILKVYIYKEGERPIFHHPQPVLSGIYASEGWFMKHMEESRNFVTNNPKQAHLFYIPFSSRILEEKLYVTGSGSRDNLVQHLKNYINLIATKYDSWNRTGGSDHFLVACHDWATDETRKSMDTCIRALCNSDVKREGFQLGKDVSLPETYVRSPQNPLRELGGKPSSQRPVLAFFAGQMHGDVRPILLKHWENKDPDMKIFGKLKKSKGNKSYIQYMKSSKYCICAKGYEVNSPRVVEAIFHECVPVIISDNFVPPFFEILNWEAFAVFVEEKDIPNLKNILLSISKRRYLVMQQRVKKVQQHFLWHVKPVKYDMFHMILHSIWYNRVFRVNPIG